MVIFQRGTLERELTQEELERQRLHLIKNSDAWKQHAALHRKTGLGDAQLHVAQEPVFGEQDPLRMRFDLPQRTSSEKQGKEQRQEHVSYGVAHRSGEAVSYVAAGSNPALWAACNCGAEFKAEMKSSGGIEVKSYGVVGSDAKATNYAVSTNASYGERSGFSGYTSEQGSSGGYV